MDPDLEYLQNLIFWITLQEEINYLVRIPDMQAGTLPTAGTLRPSTVQGKMFPLQSGPCVTDVITTKVRGLIYMYCLTVRPFITIKIMLPKLLQRNNSNAFSTRANALLLLYFDI